MPRGTPKRASRPTSAPLELDVVELAPGGHGVAFVTHQGERRAVFVPRAAAGDTLRATVDFSTRPARATPLAVLAPSPDRRPEADLPCPHLAACGACDFMHLTPIAQARAHESFVRAHLPPAFRDAPIVARDAPAPGTRTRARARVHVHARPGRPPVVGMFARSTNMPVAVPTCAILTPAIDAARAGLAALLAGARGEGEAHLAMGRTTAGASAPVVALVWKGDPLPAAVYARAEAAVAGGHLAGLALDGAVIGDAAPRVPAADGEDFVLPVGGFAQAHGATNAALVGAVCEEAKGLFAHGAAAPSPAPRVLLELYAGSGNLTVGLARALHGDDARTRIVAVESVAPACDAARANLARRGLAGHTKVVHADADRYPLPEGTRVVVLDPPRSGARAACEALAKSKVHGVVMVSCDPATLGRDLAILAPRYELLRLETFEMFPETSHVETLAVLRARPKKAP